MATWPVRFTFCCGEKELNYVHNVSRNLVTVGAQAAQYDAEYANLFLNILKPIIKEYEAACLVNLDGFFQIVARPE